MKNENINHPNSTDFFRRDGDAVSAWQKVSKPDLGHSITDDGIYDALIIGGGITGLTTALLLQLKGNKCAVIEAHQIGYGTTGGTTAHFNTFLDTTYPEIEQDFGEKEAKLVAQSTKDSLALITQLIGQFNIDCDFEFKDAYLYSENEKESKLLDEILESSKKAGIDVVPASSNHLPIGFDKVIKFSKQAQFHPLKYLNAIAAEFVKAGGVILENHLVHKTGYQDGVHSVEGEEFKLKGHYVVHATHHPHGINLFNFTCAPYRSYVLGVRLADDAYPEHLVYDSQEPYHYFRTHVIDGQKYLIVGGEDHKTGHDDPEKAFEQLTAYVNQYFNVASIDFKWSSQYYIPSDGLPYIGDYPSADEGCYVATGFNGNGMTLGTLAAKIICDAVTGIENPYASLYKPSRIKPVAGFKEFVKENADVAWRFIADRFSAEDIS
ncbi:MAG: FAD-binding oxidoreductase, partial [Pedobacter sp.]